MKRIVLFLMFYGCFACGYSQVVQRVATKGIRGKAVRATAEKAVTDALQNSNLPQVNNPLVYGKNPANKGTVTLPQSNPKLPKNVFSDITQTPRWKAQQKQWEEEMDSLKKMEERVIRLDSIAGYTRMCGDWIATIKNSKQEEKEYYRIAVKLHRFSVRVKRNELKEKNGGRESIKYYECTGIWRGRDSLSWLVDKGYSYKDKKVPSRWGEKLSTYSHQVDRYEAVLVDSILKCTRKTVITYYDDYGDYLWVDEKKPSVKFTCIRKDKGIGEKTEKWKP